MSITMDIPPDRSDSPVREVEGEREKNIVPYIRSSGAEPLSGEAVKTLAGAAGLRIPPEDLESLAESLTSQLAAIDVLDRLDLAHVHPALQFDPRWPAEHDVPRPQGTAEWTGGGPVA